MKGKLRIILIVVAVLIVLVLIVPFLIPVNQFRPTIEEKASAALGRKVQLGNMSLSLISGSLSAENLSIGEDPKFSSSPFLTAKSLKVGVEMIPLIFSKTLNVTGVTIPANGIYLPGANTFGVSTNGVQRLTVSPSGNVVVNNPSAGVPLTIYEALNAINAQKTVATYETGSFTGTLTGCTTAPTATVNWSRAGNVICMELPTLTAASNSTTCTITGVPAALTPARLQTMPCSISDNTVASIGGAIISGVVVTLARGDANAFNIAGTKGCRGGSLVYNLT